MQALTQKKWLIGLVSYAGGAAAYAQTTADARFWRSVTVDALANGAIALLVFILAAVFWVLIKSRHESVQRGDILKQLRTGIDWLPATIAMAACCLGLILTGLNVRSEASDILAQTQQRFQQQADRLEQDIQHEFHEVLGPLKSSKSIMLSSETLNRKAFKTFVEARDIHTDYPGVVAIGVMDAVAPLELPAYRAQQRLDAGPGFLSSSVGKDRVALPVRYIEPAGVFESFIGFDAGTIAAVQDAADRATLSGKPTLSAPVQWLDGTSKSQNLVYLLPVYTQTTTPLNETQRRDALKAWTFAVVSIDRLMAHPQKNTIGLSNFQLSSGPALTGSNRLYESKAMQQAPLDPPLLSVIRPVLVGDQWFQLRVDTTEEFEKTANLHEPGWIAFRGVALSLLLSSVLWMLLKSRVKAVKLADGMTSDLRRLALVAQAASNSIVITDTNRRIIWVNDGFVRLTGYSREEAMGQSPGRLLQSEKTEASTIATIRRDLEAQRGGRYQLSNRSKYGVDYWLDIDLRPMLDDCDNLTGFLAITTDITEAYLAKLALSIEKERSDILLSANNVGTWQSNLKDREFLFSDRWAAMMGFSRDEVLPRSDIFLNQRIHPDDIQRHRSGIALCLRGERDDYAIELRVAHKSERWVWILSRAKVISRGPDGRVIWMGGVHTDITEAKQLEFSLRDTQASLDRASRMARLGIWTLDVETEKVSLSEQACRIYGLLPGAVVTLSQSLSYFDPQERTGVEQAVQTASRQGVAWELTARFINARGETLWVLFTGEPEFNDHGTVRLVGAIQDVTRDQESQLRIKNSEEILRGSIDAINEAYVLYDAEDRLVYCNEKYRELYADSADLIVPGASFEAIVRGGAARGQYAHDEREREVWIQQRLAQHRSGNVSIEQRLGNGRWVRVVERKMPNGHLVGFRVEITELKQAIETAQATSARLMLTSRTLQAVLDSAVDVGIVAMGTDRLISVFNTGAEMLLGYTAEEVVGKAQAGRFFERAQLASIAESLELVFGRAPTEDEIFRHVGENLRNTQWTIVRKDKSTFVASVVLSPLVDSDGLPSGYLSIFQDISKQKEYESSLRQAMQLAEQSSISKSQFLANMSHEIRTPMNAILGMLQLLNNTALSPQQKDYATKTQGAAKSLLGLLNDILDFSKVEAGKMQLDPQPFAVSELLADLSVILSANLGAKNVDLLFDLDPELPQWLVGDALRIKQVLINLGGNAVKFTEHGQVVIGWRRVQTLIDGVRVEVSVRDSGIGIAPENQGRIFEAFTQAEASTTRRFGGTGLGLVISTRLVRLMGAELELQSVLGSGSAFSFVVDFPVAKPAVTGLSLPAPTASSNHINVLLVDDNPVALRTSAAQMRALGWSVTEADSGHQAIALVEKKLTEKTIGFDAVFVDWQMPVQDGWETLRTVRRMYGDEFVPALVMMSGQGQSALSERSIRDRELLDGFMVKPLTATMFAQALEQGRLNVSSATDTALASAAVLLPGSPLSLTGMRVLVVEDNLINQQVARELLVSEGASVTLADNGQQGVHAVLAADPQFHAVLMDLQMPVMDGMTACRALRARPELAALPVIAMTANAMASDREECLAAGMNDHVGKPFDLQHLVKVLLHHTKWVPTPVPLVSAVVPVMLSAVPREEQTQVWPPEIGVAVALRRMGNNVNLLKRTVEMFAKDANQMAKRAEVLRSNGDFAGAQRELHSLKGLAGTLAIDSLSAHAAAAERFAKLSESGPLQEALLTLTAEIEVIHPLLLKVASQLGSTDPATAPPVKSAGPPPAARIFQQLKVLYAALLESDMTAMELHADLQRLAAGEMEGAMDALDAAMADLDFDQGAIACEKLLQQFSTLGAS